MKRQKPFIKHSLSLFSGGSIAVLVLITINLFAQDKKDRAYPCEPGASLQLISRQFSFTEGPAADSKGNVFFTDQPNNRIWKYSIDGSLSVFMEPAGRSNGLFFDNRNRLYACADENNQLWRIEMNKKVEVLLSRWHNQLFNGPNDVWVSHHGDVYFTDPYYKRDYWTRTQPPLAKQGVYILKKDGAVPVIMDDSMVRPNGIVGTPDGKLLYVADIGAGKTYRFKIDKNGTLTDKTLFVDQGSDGMTIDKDGNLYLTGEGITVYNRHGVKINHIPVDAKWTANVCFGGKNRDWLFITASESLYKIKMQVKGVK